MDHGGQFEREGRVMSHVPVDEVVLCDNLPNPEALTAHTHNLNETNLLDQSQSPEGELRLIQKTSFNNNGTYEEEDQRKKGYREEDEEDNDEVMKEEEELEESEELSGLIRCQSPDTAKTDSSYSETGSMLETSYPLSPGTSPEPTSPVIPVISPETAYPISPVEFRQDNVKVDSHMSDTGSVAFTTGLIDSTTLTITSNVMPISPTGPACITDAADSKAKNTDFAEHLTSSTEPVFKHGPASSYTEPIKSTTEAACTTRLDTSFDPTPMCTTRGPFTSTTKPTTTGTESTSTTGPITSNWEHLTSVPVPTYMSVSTCTTGPIPSPALLESLEQLAQRGDDNHFPHYLHQIAEAFVLQEDYQRALWCIQLERIYHQRVLDNLNTLQEQWESQCKMTSSDLATQHLDILKHICQTHNRPGARDAVSESLDFLWPAFEEGALPSCTSAHQVDGGMEQKATDSSRSQNSHPVIPSINLADRLNFLAISKMDGDVPERELDARDGFHGSQLTDKQDSGREGGVAAGGVERTISAVEKGLHPSTAGGMDQSKPAEQQGGDLGSAEGKEAKRKEEEGEVEEAAEALQMEDEGEEEEEEKQKESGTFGQKALPVETLVSGAEGGVQLQEALAEEKLHVERQASAKTCLHQEADFPHEAHIEQQEQHDDDDEEEEEEYEVEQADIIRDAASLDDMAKLITIEEMSPASGLVSILKKRTVCVSPNSEPQPDKPTAKRRVRFKVPGDDYDQDVGGGDSCLLLFLLCLVTVVISVGGTALYCALGDAHSSVCQDFSRNADFYMGQIQRGIAHVQHWLAQGS
ncbi:consortin [Echeneis naucrates]|uniref:Uncharacterized protein n=1 Tax=Echeneis naucrates TaxID=173247 RepID=A0A665V1Q2_ECHNA|nr:consortin [Echeneis naucrates]XP_029354502.1 consortin [Echeneis naucrates]